MEGVTMRNNFRYVVPNFITLLSLICGIASILSSAQGKLKTAGVLILLSTILDFWDGYLARKLNARSEFGLQLDSIVDMVSLGVAPILLIFQHMRAEGNETVWAWVCVILVGLAGASRLARFNLLPQKETGNEDSAGLTISFAGGTIALAVLAELSYPTLVIPTPAYLIFLALLSFLMVSTISFPQISWLVLTRIRTAFVISFIVTTLILFPLFSAWFTMNIGYIGIGLSRATFQRVMKITQ
jgi:CDP-diacylglycerol--serine O-phosphatidyltransferase